MIRTLPLADDLLEAEPYVGYAYSYPHKSSYGPLDPPVALAPLWQAERRDALFLYLHIPFCEMRCGFCNLFARAGGDADLVDAYLDALERQARVLADATAGNQRIARLALGGGTPTYLSAAQLHRLFDLVETWFQASPSRIPTSVETSPKTATAERLAVLRERGVQRVSIGVQSFFDDETHAIGRPQSIGDVHRSLDRLRGFPIVNIDLIYGQPGQTVPRWLASVETAVRYRPEELYLYPLYVRPNTGIGRRDGVERAPANRMRHLYREARDLLTAAGYEAISMRYFRRRGTASVEGPIYCCQTDAMLGLGAGARSYTEQLHWSSRFAVEAAGVQRILNEWVQQSEDDFAHASWGCRLSADDRRRRYVIQSLLTLPGLGLLDYAQRFGASAFEDFPQMDGLIERGLAERCGDLLRLTRLGFEFSDAIGPSLYAPMHRERLEEFAQA